MTSYNDINEFTIKYPKLFIGFVSGTYLVIFLYLYMNKL